MRTTLLIKTTLLLFAVLLSLQAMSQDLAPQIYNIHDGQAMEKLYCKLNQKSYAKKELDDLRSHIAMQYAFENRLEKAVTFIEYISDAPLRANRYFSLARNQKKLKDYTSAMLLGKKAFEIAMRHIHEDYSDHEAALQPASILTYSTILLVELLVEDQSYDRALSYLDRTIEKTKSKPIKQLYLMKAEIFEQQHKYRYALDAYSYIFALGRQSDDIKNKMGALYPKSQLSDSMSFERYVEKLQQSIRLKLIDSISKSQDLLLAPNFELKNIEGNRVSLRDLKGKIVVLDFWATWCTPCKASFPAMQAALNQYSDNNDVVFLFINTWERDQDAKAKASRFIQESGYSFNVLFDKASENAIYEVVTKYGVKGLPEKIFIDREGYIRYRLTGFNGNTEATVQEIKDIVEHIEK